jgi:excisionase family DNA binding protein
VRPVLPDQSSESGVGSHGPPIDSRAVSPLTLELAAGKLLLSEAALSALAGAVAQLLQPAGPAAEVSPYLTVAQAAAYLQTSRQRIYDLLSARRLPKYKDGARALVRRDDLDTYLSGNQR